MLLIRANTERQILVIRATLVSAPPQRLPRNTSMPICQEVKVFTYAFHRTDIQSIFQYNAFTVLQCIYITHTWQEGFLFWEFILKYNFMQNHWYIFCQNSLFFQVLWILQSFEQRVKYDRTPTIITCYKDHALHLSNYYCSTRITQTDGLYVYLCNKCSTILISRLLS